MIKRQGLAAICAVILIVLLSSSAAKSQWDAGASVRMLSDAKSFGGSFEIGKQYSFGWLFLQGAYVYRRFDYNKTFFGFIQPNYYPNGYAIGPGAVEFPERTEVGGFAYAAGAYTAKTYAAYLPLGSQFVISATYCYPLSKRIIVGPMIGIALQNQAPVAATSEIEGHQSAPLYGPMISEGSDFPPASDKMAVVGNFGGCVMIALSNSVNPALLMLDYATETGAGAGLAFPM